MLRTNGLVAAIAAAFIIAPDLVPANSAAVQQGGKPSPQASLGAFKSHKYVYVDLGPAEYAQINRSGDLLIIREGGPGSITEIRGHSKTYVLPPTSAKYSRIGVSINDQGDVVGEIVSKYVLPALWRNHALRLLGGAKLKNSKLKSRSIGVASGINNYGVVVGSRWLPHDGSDAVIFTETAMKILPRPRASVSSNARGITDNDTIFGWYKDKKQTLYATVWHGSHYTILPVLSPYTNSQAFAGNAANQFAGVSSLTGNSGTDSEESVRSATIWKNGKAFELKSLGGNKSTAYAINLGGWAGGSSTTVEGAERAVIWDDTGVHDLNVTAAIASPDTTLQAVNQVTDDGFIIGQSLVSGNRHQFELIPTP